MSKIISVRINGFRQLIRLAIGIRPFIQNLRGALMDNLSTHKRVLARAQLGFVPHPLS